MFLSQYSFIFIFMNTIFLMRAYKNKL